MAGRVLIPALASLTRPIMRPSLATILTLRVRNLGWVSAMYLCFVLDVNHGLRLPELHMSIISKLLWMNDYAMASHMITDAETCVPYFQSAQFEVRCVT